MPRLLVTPLSSLPDVLKTHGPSHLVNLLSPEHMIATPDSFPLAAHLKLGVNDIIDPAAGTALPYASIWMNCSPSPETGMRRRRW